jgi:glycine/D-amino acid oxidase-like deaminating enzyme
MPAIPVVAPSPDFPSTASAVVIGAGIAGMCTALELQARGLDVVVVEKGEVAAEQSSRNWGWCRQMGRDPREIPLIKVSLGLWRGMSERIGVDTGYRSCGIVYLAETVEDLAWQETWFAENAKPHGLSTRLITAAEVAKLVPGSTRAWAGGLYTADDGRAEPFVAVPAMARYFQAQGGKIFTQCAARGVEQKAGRVSAVVTERGVIATDTVVLAGGYWSERFLFNLGLRFPQTGVISSVMRTSPIDLGHERTFSGNRFAARKRLDGGYTLAPGFNAVAELTPNHLRYIRDFLPLLRHDPQAVKLRFGARFFQEWALPRRWTLDALSPFEMVRVLDPKPHAGLLQEVTDALTSFYPAFKDLKIIEQWGGMIDATPDAVPVIGRVAAVPGLFLVSGFSGHGFGLGPGAGQLMAEIIRGDTPCVDPEPFRFSRFSDGTRIAPSSGL